MALTIIENEPLAKYTSWRIGGPARYFMNAGTPEEVRAALTWANERALPVFVMGGGTNLLARDTGFDGLVLRCRSQELRVEAQDDIGRAWIAAGAPMAGSVRKLAAQGWGGLQWAEGLPGTIGGAVFGNAGCYGGDVATVLVRAWLLIDNTVEEWPVERFVYGYRTSMLKQTKDERRTTKETKHKDDPFALRPSRSIGPIVLAAEFNVQRADPRELAAQMERTAAERKGKTPWGSSCGSVFKNPPRESAGRLLEAAGLKGTRVGGAEIAQKHANYIVNLGGASSADVLGLIEIAREQVLKEFGVGLDLEVQIL
ncbi:MAG: UDP-N-acetylmuramate dehydrogenase [Roseiflexaceae bacterium]